MGVLACCNFCFWISIFFFGMYSFKIHWSDQQTINFEWIHQVSKGLMLMGNAVVGAGLSFQEMLLPGGGNLLVRMAVETMHTLIMLPAGGAVAHGPWAVSGGPNENVL